MNFLYCSRPSGSLKAAPGDENSIAPSLSYKYQSSQDFATINNIKFPYIVTKPVTGVITLKTISFTLSWMFSYCQLKSRYEEEME